ncbi:AMP-binding protein, partial [Dolichospermum sp. ST_sed2]|nr:AMP-binding protein [Dolichospermum sp. ST_sed2]
ATSLFSKDAIESLSNHFIHLLEQLTEDSSKPYSQISLLLPTEEKQLLHDWNSTDSEFQQDIPLYQLFEEQVLKTPNSIAVVFEGQSLTYSQLNAKSNQVARYITEVYKKKTKKELLPGTLIALHLGRSLEMMIGIIAVLKSGGAYVPMDPSYPQEMINYILEDTKAELILGQKSISDNDDM